MERSSIDNRFEREGVLENIERTRLTSGLQPVEEATSRAAEVLLEPSSSYITSLFNYFSSRDVRDISGEDLTLEVARFLGISGLNKKAAEALKTVLEDPDGRFNSEFRQFIQLAGRVRNENLIRYVQGDPNPYQSVDERLRRDFEDQFSSIIDLISEKSELLTGEDSSRLLRQILFRVNQRANPNPKGVLNLVAKELKKQIVTEEGFVLGADQRESLKKFKPLAPLDSLVDQSYRYIEGSGDIWAKFSVEPVNYPSEDAGPLNVAFHLGVAHEDVKNPAETLVSFDLHDLGPLSPKDKTTILTALTASLVKDEPDLKETVIADIAPKLSREVDLSELTNRMTECHKSIRSQLGLIEMLAGTPKTQSEFKRKLDQSYHKKRLQVLTDRVVSFLSTSQDLDKPEREKLTNLAQNPKILFQLLHLGPGKIHDYLQSEVVPTEHENIELFFDQMTEYMERYHEDPWDIMDHIYLGDWDWKGNAELRQDQIRVIKDLYKEIYQTEIEQPSPPSVFKASPGTEILSRIVNYFDIEEFFALEDEVEIRKAVAQSPEFEAAIGQFLDACETCQNAMLTKLNQLRTDGLVKIAEEILGNPDQTGLETLSQALFVDELRNLDDLSRKVMDSRPEWGTYDYEVVLEHIQSRLLSSAIKSSDLSALIFELDHLMPSNLRHYVARDYRLESTSELEKLPKRNPEVFVQYMAFVGACHQAVQKLPAIQTDPMAVIVGFERLREVVAESLTLDAFQDEVLILMNERLYELPEIGFRDFVYSPLRYAINSVDVSSFEKLDRLKKNAISDLDDYDMTYNQKQAAVSQFFNEYNRNVIFQDEGSQIVKAKNLFTSFQKVADEIAKLNEMMITTRVKRSG